MKSILKNTSSIKKLFAVVGFFACALAVSAQGQSRQSVSSEKNHQSYVPELAELMTITQARFSKLSYAPEANNWELASYEAAHLRKTFEIAAKLYPVFRNIQQKKLIHDVTEPALNRIDEAIGLKDLRSFVRAIEALRIACNDCHLRANVGFIIIGSPLKALTGPQPKEPRR